MFSIVVTVYNKKNTIISTIKSVINQTFINYELIIVDDGSSDGSIDLIRSNFNDDRIKIIQQDNRGVSVARNVGIVNSNYNYISFLDGDDEWLPNYLDKVFEAIKLYPNAGLYNVPALHKNVKTGSIFNSTVRKWYGKTLTVNLFEHPYNICAQTSGVTVNKEILDKLPFSQNSNWFPPEMKYEEDMTVFFSLALLSEVIYIGFAYSIRNISVEGQLVSKKNNSIMYIYQSSYLNYLLQSRYLTNNSIKLFNQFYKYELRTRISSCIREGTYEKFLTHIDLNVSRILPVWEWILYSKIGNMTTKLYINKLFRIKFYLRKYNYKQIS